MTQPLTCWLLFARELPEEMTDSARPAPFFLPGAKALEGFSELLGESESMPEEDESLQESAPFSLPAMLPDTICGPVSLHREIDFGAFEGDRAILTLDHIVGSGRILLGETVLCTFDSARFTADAYENAHAMTAQPCMLAVDLSDVLELGRRETLIIEFNDVRPAGLPGPVLFHVTAGAHLSCISIQPDARRQTAAVGADLTAVQKGRYVLRAQAIPAKGEPALPWETALTLDAGERRHVQFSLSLSAASFVSAIPYDAPVLKLLLFSRPENARGDGMLCDSATLLCGLPGKAPAAWLPLDPAFAHGDPSKNIEILKALRIPAVSLASPAPDSLYRALCRAGISVRQYMPTDHPLRHALSRLPCILTTDQPEDQAAVSLEASAWQLCSMISAPRMLDETLTPRELLCEASGLPLDPSEEGVHGTLLWLRALSVRLRAEASRQSRFRGALCAAGEWENPDIEAALRTAFSPLHLSALPLSGAWWTGTRFSASLEAFISAGTYESSAKLSAQAILEDGDGHELARFESPCRAAGGYVGVIDTTLPDSPCVLELTTRLLLDGKVIEESTMPVYVGERGPLEAAFI